MAVPGRQKFCTAVQLWGIGQSERPDSPSAADPAPAPTTKDHTGQNNSKNSSGLASMKRQKRDCRGSATSMGVGRKGLETPADHFYEKNWSGLLCRAVAFQDTRKIMVATVRWCFQLFLEVYCRQPCFLFHRKEPGDMHDVFCFREKNQKKMLLFQTICLVVPNKIQCFQATMNWNLLHVVFCFCCFFFVFDARNNWRQQKRQARTTSKPH